MVVFSYIKNKIIVSMLEGVLLLDDGFMCPKVP